MEEKNSFGKLLVVAVVASVISGVIVAYINDTDAIKKLKPKPNGKRRR